MTPPPEERREQIGNIMWSMRRGSAVLWITAASLLALFAAYVVAANVILRTRLLRSWINEGPDSTWVGYTSASSLWPGRFRVENLLIRDRDKDVEWMISIDEASGSCSLIDLLSRTFHPRHVRGSGAVVRVRRRPRPGEAATGRPRALPSITGLPDPPPPQAKGPERRDGAPWTTLIEDLAVEGLREVWIDEFRYEGAAVIAGGMFLAPHRRLEIFPTRLRTGSGLLSYAGDPIARELRASLEWNLDRCDLESVTGNEVLRFVSGSLRAHGEEGSVDFLNALLETPEWLHLRGGRGDLTATIDLEEGRGTASLRFDFADAEARLPDTRLWGRATGELRLAPLDFHRGTGGLRGTRIDLRDVRQSSGRPSWWGSLEVISGGLRRANSVEFAGSVRARSRDARPLYRLMNAKLPGWAEQILDLEGFEGDANVVLARSFLDVPSFHATGGSFSVRGAYRQERGSRRGSILIERGILSLGVGLADAGSEIKILRPRRWFEERTGVR